MKKTSEPRIFNLKKSKKSIKKKFYRVTDIPSVINCQFAKPILRQRRNYEVLYN
jgi:hypothetical protein